MMKTSVSLFQTDVSLSQTDVSLSPTDVSLIQIDTNPGALLTCFRQDRHNTGEQGF